MRTKKIRDSGNEDLQKINLHLAHIPHTHILLNIYTCMHMHNI